MALSPTRSPRQPLRREFDLSAHQIDRLERLQNEVRESAIDQLREIGSRLWTQSQSGASVDTAAILSETARLVKQRDEARPPRDLALAILFQADPGTAFGLIPE